VQQPIALADSLKSAFLEKANAGYVLGLDVCRQGRCTDTIAKFRYPGLKHPTADPAAAFSGLNVNANIPCLSVSVETNDSDLSRTIHGDEENSIFVNQGLLEPPVMLILCYRLGASAHRDCMRVVPPSQQIGRVTLDSVSQFHAGPEVIPIRLNLSPLARLSITAPALAGQLSGPAAELRRTPGDKYGEQETRRGMSERGWPMHLLVGPHGQTGTIVAERPGIVQA